MSTSKSISPSKKVATSNGIIIDEHCQHQNATILGPKDDPYSCTLNQTDLKTNKNKFYIMHAIKANGQFICYIRYGRIGEVGKIIYDSYSSESSATNKFIRQFKSKTGNHWSDKANITPKKGKYYLCDISYDLDDDKNKDKGKQITAKIETKIPDSKLDSRVQNLMSLISDVEIMKNSLVELNIDTKKLPLGKLSQGQISKGFKILQNIAKKISDPTTAGDLLDMSSEFYTIIPYACRRSTPPAINNAKILSKFNEVLSELSNIQVATKILDQNKQLNINPLDQFYDGLKTDIISLDKNSETWKLISNYIMNGHASTHTRYTGYNIMDIYEITRHGENERFERENKDLNNRYLLFHGTRISCVAGITKLGLLLRPEMVSSGVRITGKMFGYGVYFSDTFSKSFNYCGANASNPEACFFLAEVALGNMSRRKKHDYYITKQSLTNEGCHSTYGMGSTSLDMETNYVEKDGYRIPTGKLKQSGKHDLALLYNEFVVYDTSQIKLKYIIRVKGDFRY